jgi:hypothetical protein
MKVSLYFMYSFLIGYWQIDKDENRLYYQPHRSFTVYVRRTPLGIQLRILSATAQEPNPRQL